MKMALPPPRSVVSSSPGRPEKLATAPGLSRLLRGKSGSRSGGRTPSAPRSSPMFISRSRSVGPNTAAAGEGDPSSPKVSCIGQVRIRNKKKTAAKLARKTSYHQHQQQQHHHHQLPAMRCRCLSRAMLCRIWPCGGHPNKTQRRRWSVGRWWFKKKNSGTYREAGGEEEVAAPIPPALRASVSDFSVSEETEEEEEEETRVFMPSATATPPKNALLLMRCRSAPHNRSSALSTARFAVLETEPTEPPVSVEEVKVSCTDRTPSPVLATDETEEAAAPKLMLTRCKSEPARTAAAKLAVAEENVVAYRNSDSRRRPTAPPPSPPAMNGV